MLQLIGFDGDDTLWHSEGYYRAASEAFAAIMGRYVDLGDQHVHDSMLATEQRNLKLFGYGAKGMALSMVETAIAISDGRISAADIHRLVELGKTVLQHPVELDRKSTRLNSSHVEISYAVFCLKKKKKNKKEQESS